MAWKTGPHAQAPQGVICYGADQPGEVTWFDDPDAEKAPTAAKEPAPKTPPPAAPPPTAPRSERHG